MYALKGFIVHAAMTSNAPGQVALIGELSTQSSTFSREKGYYTDAVAPGQTLVSMLSEDNGVAVQATSETVTHVMRITRFIYNKTLETGGPMFTDELLSSLITNYASVADKFACGEIITDGNYYMPEWVSWRSKLPDLGDNLIKIWFVDGSFANQYDEYDIVVVSPLENLDDFFRVGSQVEVLLKAVTLPIMGDRIQTAKLSQPETIVRIDAYEYVDPLNAAHKVLSNWGVLIYGAAGNNIDAIKDALVEYILDNSTHTRKEWTPVLPDIFKRTEFILIPIWDAYAIPNRTVEAGIHSPIVTLSEVLARAKVLISEYPTPHINSHALVLGHPYKSLAIISCGGPENRDARYRLTDIFPDYIDVASTSVDFNRMDLATQTWALELMRMIIAAETVTQFSAVPIGMTKTTRGQLLYVVKSYQNVHYLVATKASLVAFNEG